MTAPRIDARGGQSTQSDRADPRNLTTSGQWYLPLQFEPLFPIRRSPTHTRVWRLLSVQGHLSAPYPASDADYTMQCQMRMSIDKLSLCTTCMSGWLRTPLLMLMIFSSSAIAKLP